MKKAIFLVLFSLAFILSCSSSKETFTKYRVFHNNPNDTIMAGSSGYIALGIEIPEGSHIYGNPKGPGTGRPTTAQVKPYKGLMFKPARYLNPEKFTNPGEEIPVFGYTGKTNIFIPFTSDKSIKPGDHNIQLFYSSLICSNKECLPKDLVLNVTVKITNNKSNICKDKALATLYSKSRPAKGEGAVIDIYINKDKTAVQGSTPGRILPAFDITKGKKLETTTSGSRTTLEGMAFTPVYPEQGISGIIQAIIFGLLAGLILNVMPCVLPVVSLKLMALVKQAEQSRKESALMGLTFSGGILVSFLFLAFLAAYFGYSWGGLFQNQTFLVIMTGIIFTLAMSMFGVFKITAPGFAGSAATGKVSNQYLDSFYKGLLATLLATPCSGPFLGGTLAWALTQPPLIIFLIFISIGLGMASPYIALAVHPVFTKLVPKPGNWMVILEKVMAFLLMFTVIYMLTIFEAKAVIPAITFIGFLGLALWIYGQWGSVMNSPKVRIAAAFSAVLVAAGGYTLSFNVLFQEKKAIKADVISYTDANLLANCKKGKIMVVKFTADWCPNCKLVESTSLFTDKVISELKRVDGIILTADITRKGTEGERMLNKLGSRSIPFLAVFPSGKNLSSPVCLRDIYSEDDVLTALRKAEELRAQGK